MGNRIDIEMVRKTASGTVAFAAVSGRSFTECAANLLLLPPAPAGPDHGYGKLQAALECTCSGIPAFLCGRADDLFRNIGCRSGEGDEAGRAGFMETAELLDVRRTKLPVARALARKADLGQPLPEAALAALADPELHRTAGEAGVCMDRVAEVLAAMRGLDTEDVLDEWDGMVLPGPPGTSFSPGAEEALSGAIRALAGRGRGQHEFNFGACGLFAATMEEVLQAGARYMVVFGPRFDPERAKGCHHVGLRVGNRIVDGNGVSRPGEFLAAWDCTFSDLHEAHMPNGGGFLDAMRPRGEEKLDAAALRRDMESAGVGPWMVLEGTTPGFDPPSMSAGP